MYIQKLFHTILLKNAPQIKDLNKYTADKIQASLDSQEKHLKDWTFKIWNENDYLKIIKEENWCIPRGERLISMEAWALISDILRIYALYHYGGAYADWDLEFIDSIPQDYFEHELVLGFEPYTINGPATAQVGMQFCMSRPQHIFWREVYKNIQEKIWTDQFDILPGLSTRLLETKYKLPSPRYPNTYYYLDSGIVIVPTDIFYPLMGARVLQDSKPELTKYYTLSPHSIAIHWEHSQIVDNDNNRSGWTRYLHLLKNDHD